MPKSSSQSQKIDQLIEDVIIIKTVLLGPDDGNPGRGGLVEKVDRICSRQRTLSRNFYILIGVLVGSGIITADKFLGLF